MIDLLERKIDAIVELVEETDLDFNYEGHGRTRSVEYWTIQNKEKLKEGLRKILNGD